MELTLIVFVDLLYTPVTLTRCAAYLAGFFWSLSLSVCLPSKRAYELEPFTHALIHSSSGWPFIIPCRAPHMVSVMVPVNVCGGPAALSTLASAIVVISNFMFDSPVA